MIVVIGILAAIAIPRLLGNREKANDASAKTLVRNGSIAVHSYAVEHNDIYPINRAEVLQLAPEMASATWAITSTGTSFVLSVTSDSGNVFSVERTRGGADIRKCTTSGKAGCPDNGAW